MSTPAKCIFSHAGIITDANDQRPCASTANGPSYCCVVGDICEGDNICHFTHPGTVLGAAYSTYYMGGCTDISYGDSSVCTPHCTNSDSSGGGGQADVVYNTTSNRWACCGATVKGPHCDVPTNEVFQALAPSAMTNTVVVLSTGIPTNSPPSTSSSTTSPTSASTTNTNTPTPSAPQSTDSSGLPSGTKIGIGIGIAIGVVALIALIGILLFFRRKHGRRLEAARRSQPGSAYHASQPGSAYGASPDSRNAIPMGYMDQHGKNAVKPMDQPTSGRQELGARDGHDALEMDAEARPTELDASGMGRR